MPKRHTGFFITFEGGEGSGKSTQLRRLLQWLEAKGLSLTVTSEPGGTVIGKKIRAILLDPDHHHLSPRAELFLYVADRAQHFEEVLAPHLAEGRIVISDRFMDSSTVYQGICRKLGVAWVEKLNAFATYGLAPDLVLLLDVPETVGQARLFSRQKKLDRLDLEKTAFHQKVRKGFLMLARKSPRRFAVVDAARSEDEVAADIRVIVEKKLRQKGLWKTK